ncbi:hypothetical protein ACOZ3Q_000608 [Cronobacter sakazakii]
MDKSREQFEEFAQREKLSLAYSDCGYVYTSTDMAWRAWQASRAAIELELPPTIEVHPLGPSAAKMFCELHKNTVAECANSIRAAGIKVKGE